MNFSAVVSKRTRSGFKELRRTVGLPYEEAYKIARAFNKTSRDETWGAETCYVEETASVKHLPVVRPPYYGGL